MDTMVLEPLLEPVMEPMPSLDLLTLEFEMTGPAADSFTMDFSLCTSTTTTCSVTGPRPK